jgi:hypothetical protein
MTLRRAQHFVAGEPRLRDPDQIFFCQVVATRAAT